MELERIGSSSFKILLDRKEAAVLYRRLACAPISESQTVIASLLEATAESCGINLRSGAISVEIIDSPDGAVIYCSTCPNAFYLSDRRFRSISRSKSGAGEVLFCFDTPKKLLNFIKASSCTPAAALPIKLYAYEGGFIAEFRTASKPWLNAWLGEFCAKCRNEGFPQSCQLIGEYPSLRSLKELSER